MNFFRTCKGGFFCVFGLSFHKKAGKVRVSIELMKAILKQYVHNFLE